MTTARLFEFIRKIYGIRLLSEMAAEKVTFLFSNIRAETIFSELIPINNNNINKVRGICTEKIEVYHKLTSIRVAFHPKGS